MLALIPILHLLFSISALVFCAIFSAYEVLLICVCLKSRQLFLCFHLLILSISNVNIVPIDVVICFLQHSVDQWYWLVNINTFYIFIFHQMLMAKVLVSWVLHCSLPASFLNVTLDFSLYLTYHIQYITKSCRSCLINVSQIYPLFSIPTIATLTSYIWSTEIVSSHLKLALLVFLSSLVFIQ